MSSLSRSARVLQAAIGQPGSGQPVVEDSIVHWLEFVRSERVIPLLAAIVTTGEHHFSPPDQRTIEAAQLDAMAVAVRLEHHLLQVKARLEAADITVAVLKGAATAHLDYDDPSLRQFGDVDLLVDPRDFPRACALLKSAGWNQPYALPRGHERFTHAVTFQNTQRMEIDLHQHVAHRALGRLIPTDALLADSVFFEIAGQPVRALCRADRLIHAAVHTVASRGSFRRLSSLADVLRLAESSTADAEQILDRADRWRVRLLVARAVSCAYETAQVPCPSPWSTAARRPTVHRDRLVERAYLSNRRRPIWEELAYLRAMSGWLDRGRYVGGYLVPGQDYAERRRRTNVLHQGRYLWSRIRSNRGIRRPPGS